MTGALTLITPMLARLIPRLSSPFDGEKLATLAAIERVLKAKSLDFNALATAVDRPTSPPRIVYRDRPAPAAEPSRSYSPGPNPDGRRRDLARVQWLLLAPERLTFKEAAFLRSIRGRPAVLRPLSLRQREWLNAIYARASREYA